MFVRAVGGHYHTLKPMERSGFNPLALPDIPANRAFLVTFLEQLLTASGEALTEIEQAFIPQAVDYNYTRTDQRRRLSDMREAFLRYRRPGGAELGARLDPWCEDGPHGWLFDQAQDTLDLRSRVLGMDVSVLMEDPVLHDPAMAYLFHRVEMALDGQPAIIVADGVWSTRHERAFAPRLRAFGQALARQGAILGTCFETATESLAPPISSALVDPDATLMVLPNPNAREQDYVDGLGLSQHEFEEIQAMTGGARTFLVKQGRQSILARLDLVGLEKVLTVLAPGKTRLGRMDQLRAARGDAPARWLPELLTGPASR
jgi:type IV secretion system protein VirB4